jgi:hypothetical protein
MKQEILTNWNFMRFFRLALGIAIIVQAAFAKDLTMGILGAMFTAMPIFNVGCCGVGGCATTEKKQSTPAKEITYEEVV